MSNYPAWSKADENVLRLRWGRETAATLGKRFKPPRSKGAIFSKAKDLGLLTRAEKAEFERLRRVGRSPAPPSAEEIEWSLFTHWEPGPPSEWKEKARENPIYLRLVRRLLDLDHGVPAGLPEAVGAAAN
jgi:hypothetical protein